MIPRPNTTEWSRVAPWTTTDQVEQDLLLARLIIEIANDDYLGTERVFRCGTCLHKLRISPPLRYSEDLDYVRRSEGGIGELITALRQIGERLGMKVNYDISRYPKGRFSAPFESGSGTIKIKIEVNTFERSPARPPEHVLFTVNRAGSPGQRTCKHSLRRSFSPPRYGRSTNAPKAATSSTYGLASPAWEPRPMT